jgi:hypothetical protein
MDHLMVQHHKALREAVNQVCRRIRLYLRADLRTHKTAVLQPMIHVSINRSASRIIVPRQHNAQLAEVHAKVKDTDSLIRTAQQAVAEEWQAKVQDARMQAAAAMDDLRALATSERQQALQQCNTLCDANSVLQQQLQQREHDHASAIQYVDLCHVLGVSAHVDDYGCQRTFVPYQLAGLWLVALWS